MVKTEDFQLCQQCPDFYALDLNHMSTLYKPRQQNGLPSATNASTFSTNVAVPVVPASGLQGLKAGQSNGVNWCLQDLTFLNNSPPTHNACLGESQSPLANKLRAKGIADDVAGCNQKKFLIFDQSGCQTRLFVSAFCSSWQHPSAAAIRNIHACHVQEENQAVICEQISPLGPIAQEKLHENYKFHEESEMHEDTEEINALLYSDDDDDVDDNDDADCENDEVMSSGRSPLTIKRIYEKGEQVDDIKEVDSSDCLTKRQKLLDGGYKKLSSWNISEHADDADSSCANGKNVDKDMGYFIAKKLSRKGKIHETLRILKRIIPGVKSNDPLLIIDEAISYLKYLRHEARALGFNCS